MSSNEGGSSTKLNLGASPRPPPFPPPLPLISLGDTGDDNFGTCTGVKSSSDPDLSGSDLEGEVGVGGNSVLAEVGVGGNNLVSPRGGGGCK
jgi:hypothetical protein